MSPWLIDLIIASRWAAALTGAALGALLCQAMWIRRGKMTAAEKALGALLIVFSLNTALFLSFVIISKQPTSAGSLIYVGDIVAFALGFRVLYLSRED